MAKRGPRHFTTRKDAKVERLPWGPHDWLARPDIVDTRDLLVVRVNMPKGQSQEFHRQPGMEEVIYVLEGKAEQWVDKEIRTLRAGEIAHVPRNAVHATFNVGPGVLRFLSIFSSAQTTSEWVDCSQEEPWASLLEDRRENDRKRRRVGAPAARKRTGSKDERRTVALKSERVVRKSGKAAKTRRKPPS